MSNRDIEIKLSRDWLSRTGFWFGLGCIQAFGAAGLFSIVLLVAASHFGLLKTDDTDKDANTRSGLSLRTDYRTGCQYLISGDAMTPRLNAHGQPVCGGAQ